MNNDHESEVEKLARATRRYVWIFFKIQCVLFVIGAVAGVVIVMLLAK